jgi:hypothetical protein
MAATPCDDFVTDFHFVKELLMSFLTNSIKSGHEKMVFSKPYGIDGGAKEDRTPDLLRARQALSQLSYGPSLSGSLARGPVFAVTYGVRAKMVGLGGLEPPTSPLSGVRSNQLSYRPRLISLGSK